MKKKAHSDQRIQITSQSSSEEELDENQIDSSSCDQVQQKIQYVQLRKPEQSTIKFLNQLDDSQIQRVAQYTFRKLPITPMEGVMHVALKAMNQDSRQKVVLQTLLNMSQQALKRIIQTSIKKLPQLAIVTINQKKKKQNQKTIQKNVKEKPKNNNKRDQIQKQIRPPKSKISDIQSFQESLKPEEEHKPQTFQQVQKTVYAQQQKNETSQNQGSSSSDQGSDSQKRQSKPASGSASYEHFATFMTTYYKLHSQPARRKQFFMRREPIFERYVNTVKSDNFKDHSRQLAVINLNTFRKYMKKYHRSQGLKYQQKRNMYRMKIVMGICLKTNNNRYGGGVD